MSGVEAQIVRSMGSLAARAPARPDPDLGQVMAPDKVTARFYRQFGAPAVDIAMDFVLPYVASRDSAARRVEEVPYNIAVALLNRRLTSLARRKGSQVSGGAALYSPRAFDFMHLFSLDWGCREAGEWRTCLANVLGITLVRFDNGVRLNLKRTEIEPGRIHLVVRFGHRILSMPKDKPGLDTLVSRTFIDGGLGAHKIEELRAVFAGKTVGYEFGVDSDACQLAGTTSQRDLPLQLQVLNAFIKGAAQRMVVLASVFAERLRRTLREKTGQAYSPNVRAQLSNTFPGYGLIVASAGVAPDQAHAATELIRGVAADLATHGTTEDELERIKEPLLRELRGSEQDNLYWLHRVLPGAQENPQRLDWHRSREANLRSVDVPATNELARRYLDPQRASQFLMLPRGDAPESG